MRGSTLASEMAARSSIRQRPSPSSRKAGCYVCTQRKALPASRVHAGYQMKTLKVLLLPTLCLTPAALAQEKPAAPKVSQVLWSKPSYPEDYLERWVPEAIYYERHDLTVAEYSAEFGNEPELPEEAMERNVSLLCQALESPGKYVNYGFYEAQTPDFPWHVNNPDGDADYSPEEAARIVKAVTGYLSRLEKESRGKKPPQGLVWHGMAAAHRFLNVWQKHCRKQTFSGDQRVETELLWKTKDDLEDNSSWFGDYRYAGNRVLIVEEMPWSLLDIRTGQWTKLSPPDREPEYETPFRAGMDDKGVATMSQQFDFETRRWTKLPEIDRQPGEIYFDDPIRAGKEWIAFYENPPHYNTEKIEDFAKLPEAQRNELAESLKDRFHFLSPGQPARHFAPECAVAQYWLGNTGRLFVIGTDDPYNHMVCQKDETFQMGSDPANRELVAELGGDADKKYIFNGQWRAWHGASPDAALLEQSLDYAGRTPVRAAVWDIVAKQWELLWCDPAPQVPPPPPGVL
jgi:hypothetical protein